jgi:adenosine deaminase CECR1
LQQWAVEWERFCLWIVTEYSDSYGDGIDGDTHAAE